MFTVTSITLRPNDSLANLFYSFSTLFELFNEEVSHFCKQLYGLKFLFDNPL